ncbi:hypothetical protein LJC34_00470 [Oscillospiraceae bacterium OttesenSCG-928-G22]|nr:hypothetical protein [Oscillospiraceae bacterium OttesenSCG-928-G22]
MTDFAPWIPIFIGLFVVLSLVLLAARGRKCLLRATLITFAIAGLGGFFLYSAVYLPENPGVMDSVETLFRGIFSTGRMFLVNDDYSFLIERADKLWMVESLWYSVPFWLFHVLALFVSVSAVIGVFGRNLLDRLRFRFGVFETAYLIVGSGKRQLALAENILRHDGERKRPDTKRLVVLLAEDISGADRDYIEDIGASALSYSGGGFSSALRKAGFRSATWRIGALKVFLMPEDEADTFDLLSRAYALAKESGIAKERLSFYALSKSEWLPSRLETLFGERVGYDLHVFSEAELAARKLMQTLPPYKTIPIKDGVAERNFTALFLGFGEMGRQILRRLVMNSQFMGSDFRAVLVDREIDSTLGQFAEHYPGLLENYTIECLACDVRSAEFYGALDTLRTEVNYVVVALGDDVLNLEIAYDLQCYFKKRDDDLSPGIAVGVCDNTHVSGIAERNLTFFSNYHEVFSESTVIREDIDRMARAVSGIYSNCATEAEVLETWYKNDPFTRDSNRAVADFFPTYLHLAGLTENELLTADRSPLSAGQVEFLAQTEHLRWNAFHYAMGYEKMELAEMRRYLLALKDAEEDPAECRKNSDKRLHICLVPWEELQDVSIAYNEALISADIPSERDFQQNDRLNVDNLPLFARAARDTRTKTTRKGRTS